MTRSAWRLPGYRVEELLGAGSSGEVWRARVVATGVAVAAKRIWLSDPAQRAAALSEAAMLSSLDHPHLMRLHELRHVEDAIVLVLDLAGGGSLGSLLARRGRLTPGEAITAIAPIAAALAYAHHNGVVHGDVSPANILFTDLGLPLLADLGVARLLGDSAPVRTTPAYADPAVVGGALPGPASDVFMLGAVALHVLTGTPAWPGTDPTDVLEAARTGDPPDFAGRLRRANVADPIIAVVDRALSVEPPQRGTAADFALDLRHAGEPVAVELAAGGRRLPPVGAGARAESWPLESVPLASAPGGKSSSPVAAVPFVGEQPLTYGVRAPAPFAGARPGRHLARSRPRVAAGALACATAVAVLLAAAAFWWWPFGSPAHQRGARSPIGASAGPPRPAGSIDAASPASPAATSGPPSESAAPTATARSGGRVGAVLAALDDQRSRAYARRDPALLRAVYASPELLARDRAQLTSIVPPGCGLRGVHTRFRHVAVAGRSATSIVVRAEARLAASTLVCAGTASGRATGTGAARVRIDLVRRPGGYRIAAQRQV